MEKDDTLSNEYLTARDDAMLALDYIIHILRQNNVQDIAEALMDIIHIYNNLENHTQEYNTPSEYLDIFYMYLLTKYHSKITLDKYKEKALNVLLSQSKTHGKNTI